VERLAEVRLELAASHPAFEGHFPGEPILPGIALLDLVVGTLSVALGPGWRVAAMPVVRWRAVVRPGETLLIQIGSLERAGHVGFEVKSGETLVSHGTLVVEQALR
jgi:3-hydroxymyristoyl/3-hydroxydecanoyl-(acyl carrier protein) dehydratase